MIRLLTKPEVCEILAISRPTLDRIVADGDLAVLRIRGQVRFEEEEILRYMHSCRASREPKRAAKASEPPSKQPAQRGRPKGSTKDAAQQKHYYPGMRVVG